MAAAQGNSQWVSASTFAFLAVDSAAISAAAAIVSASVYRRSSRRLASLVQELESSLAAANEKGAAERRGRVRAQQGLRKALSQHSSDGLKQDSTSVYPMMAIGTVRSCFSTRNGTPRQPLLVPLAKACLELDPGRVPLGALEGLADYSHCWIIYVFHLNTDLDKLWKEPSRSKLKAKVRVPKLKGGKMGVLATRSPHRPCPIGLTVAKLEKLDGNKIFLSGVDLVDGTPILDIKPYLPYSDYVEGASVPKWVEANDMLAVASVSFSTDFYSFLSNCWPQVEKYSLYSSEIEFQNFIEEVLSWDIRSLSQQIRPHVVTMENEDSAIKMDDTDDLEPDQALRGKDASSPSSLVIYHLILEGIDISYRIDDSSNVIVEKAALASHTKES